MGNLGMLKYYLTQKNAFEKYYVKLLNNQKADDIHHLRLSIKRLRTLHLLMDLVSNDDFDKTSHNLLYSKLFNAAGSVRETQLNLRLIQEIKRPKHQTNTRSLSNMLTNNLQLLKSELESFDLSFYTTINNSLEDRIRGISANKVKKVSIKTLDTEFRKISSLVETQNKQPNLHQLRIRVRIIKELIILQSKIKTIKEPKTLLKKLKQLYNILGKWHDQYVMTKALKSNSKKKKRVGIDYLIKQSRKKELELKKLSYSKLLGYVKELKGFSKRIGSLADNSPSL